MHQLRILTTLLFGTALCAAQTLTEITVVSIQSTTNADLVSVDGGWNAGLRLGMACQVARQGARVAEIILVDVRQDGAVGLIVQLVPGQVMHEGDSVSVKISQTPVS